MPPFKFKRVRKPLIEHIPSNVSIEPQEQEALGGVVQGKTASAPEERMAKALTKLGKQYIFRYVVGAPKGLPGWKELDFLISDSGMLYAVEVDTAFTHRNKQQKDRLHDAIILKDQEINAMGTLFPHVFHADGESDLVNDANSQSYVKRNFGR